MRMLDVMKGMLCKAAEQSENQDRMKRMRTPPPRLRSWLILMLPNLTSASECSTNSRKKETHE
ncbi:hypothetical protein JG688_00003916 [Phytophthora aleatoria]|uniref:Uncharacterized protein n=1 Tax=Phytophthora aleatoria TaxID=2496075 RepID=A0A8J5IS87_9STRA|nr:hypothetical protein JG688_00003916 [Phytophthora aleatoria]